MFLQYNTHTIAYHKVILKYSRLYDGNFRVSLSLEKMIRSASGYVM